MDWTLGLGQGSDEGRDYSKAVDLLTEFRGGTAKKTYPAVKLLVLAAQLNIHPQSSKTGEHLSQYNGLHGGRAPVKSLIRLAHQTQVDRRRTY